MTRKLFLIAVAVFAAIAGIVFFEVELQRFAAVRTIDGALIEHFFVELDGIAALRAGDFVIAFVFVVFPCVVIVIVFVLVDVVELFFQLAEVFVDLVYLAAELIVCVFHFLNGKGEVIEQVNDRVEELRLLRIRVQIHAFHQTADVCRFLGICHACTYLSGRQTRCLT